MSYNFSHYFPHADYARLVPFIQVIVDACDNGRFTCVHRNRRLGVCAELTCEVELDYDLVVDGVHFETFTNIRDWFIYGAMNGGIPISATTAIRDETMWYRELGIIKQFDNQDFILQHVVGTAIFVNNIINNAENDGMTEEEFENLTEEEFAELMNRDLQATGRVRYTLWFKNIRLL